METQPSYTAAEKRLLIVAPVAMFVVAALATLAILVGPGALQNVRSSGRVASAAAATTTHLALDILPAKPGGPAENWPAYLASTPLTVPANHVITVIIRNFDLGDAALADGSPLARVQGTLGGGASFDGQAYTALDAAKVSHTFTIPQLGLNVPIPGDAPANASYLTVTFSFRTSRAGTYTFECFAPCGTGDNGFDGPMASMAYMKGTLTVQS
jgi:hypothetical protein